MSIIGVIPKAIKQGANFSPQTAASNGQVQGTAQAALTRPVKLPKGSSVIPAPVIGTAISMLMAKIEGLPAEAAQKAMAVATAQQAQYQKSLSAAQIKRTSAQTKLYNDLVAKQNQIKEDKKKLEATISDLEAQIIALQAKKDAEYIAYEATILEYSAKAKELSNQGKDEEAQVYIDKIKSFDYWLGQITLMMTEIVNLKLTLKLDKADLENMEYLAGIEIENDWDKMVAWAPEFEVAVPYYPDLPTAPASPSIPKFPQIPDKVRTYKKQFNKWLVCPMIAATGVNISALLLMIKEKSPHSPVEAAQLDSQAETMIPKLGGGI